MINGIVASENIIIPLDSGVFAYETIDTLKTLLIDLHEELRAEINVMMVILSLSSTVSRQFRRLPRRRQG